MSVHVLSVIAKNMCTVKLMKIVFVLSGWQQTKVLCRDWLCKLLKTTCTTKENNIEPFSEKWNLVVISFKEMSTFDSIQ